MSSQVSTGGSHSIRRKRTYFLVALAVGVAVFIAAMLVLGDARSERLASRVQAGLEWRALRGAQELSRVSEQGPAVNDAALFNKVLDIYAASPDIQAIAVEAGGKIVASHGTTASIAPVFAAQPGTLVHGDDFVASWAPRGAGGAQVDKVAVMVSRQPLGDVEDLQAQVFHLTLIAGVAAAVLGALVILWLTGRVVRVQELAVAAPEASPASPPASPDPPQPEDRTRELDDRNRWMRLVLDRAAQGFITVDLDGRMVGERSAIVDRWFGEPAVGAMLAGYLSQHGNELTSQFGRGLERIREGVVPLERGLEQMPKRVRTAANVFDVEYAPVMRGDKLEGILLILSNVTEQAAREREQQEQREQRELVALSQLITGNRAEFDEFFAEVAGLVASLDAPSDPELERRTLRTLKESCAYYGLESYVELCAGIEASLVDPAAHMTDEQRVALADGWGKVASQMMRRLA